MPKSSISSRHHATFGGIRQLDEAGNEYWSARQLAKVLEYSEYRHFLPVIGKAREACQNSRDPVADHFEDVLDMVEIGSGAKRKVASVRLVFNKQLENLIIERMDGNEEIFVRMMNDEAFKNIAASHLMRAVYQQVRAAGRAD